MRCATARSVYQHHFNTSQRVSRQPTNSSNSQKSRGSMVAFTPRTNEVKQMHSTSHFTKSSKSHDAQKSRSRSGTSKRHTRRTGVGCRRSSIKSNKLAPADSTSRQISIHTLQVVLRSAPVYHRGPRKVALRRCSRACVNRQRVNVSRKRSPKITKTGKTFTSAAVVQVAC